MANRKRWLSGLAEVRRAADERGAALIIVLVALVGLTALAAAGMVLTDTELKVSQNVEASTNAFYAADAGLQEYLGGKTDGTSAETFSYAAGVATVGGTQLLDLDDDDRVLYRIASGADYTPPEGGAASRTVTALAVYSLGTFKVKSAFTSPNGLLKNGGSGQIDGYDQATGGDPECPASPLSPVPGVAVPPGGYTQSGGSLVPDGDPPVDDSQGALDLIDETEIDWDGIVNGNALPADYTIPPDSWPDFGSMGPDEWPVIYADGNLVISDTENGQGTLIVRGNLQMNGDFEWDGIVLVGGYITSNGYQTVEGAIVGGLNLDLGESVPSSDLGNGNKKFLYNSCYVLKAKKGMGGLAQVPGTWSERM